MKLPNADKAIVPEQKITHYLLNPAHPVGGSKASFFLEFGFIEWRRLAEDLLRHARENEVVVLNVRSAWYIRPGEDAPRFVTAHPLRRL